MSFTNEFINPNDKSNVDGRTKENAVPWYDVVNSNNRVHVTDADGISKYYEILLEAGVSYVFRR
jgi:alkylated DNA nucleotide flippase Atl1